MATPTTSVLFDGTTVTGLTNDPFHASSSVFVPSGGVFAPGASTYSEMHAASPTWAGDGEAYLTISTVGTSTDPAAGVYAGVIQQPSATVSTADGYQIGYLWAGTPRIEVYKYTNAAIVSTPISQTIAALAAGDAIFLLVSGGVLTASVRRSGVWSTVTTASDSTYTFSGGGAVAEWAIYDPSGVCRIDNLGGGQVVTGGAAPTSTVAPAVTGTATTGSTLTTTNGTWTGSPTGYTYQWKRNNTNIASATASTYVLQVADEGQSIKCTVTATNASGSTSADSNTVTPSAAATAPANTVLPSITSSPTVGTTVTATTGTWTGTPTITYAYQWKLNGTNISGATASTYVIQSGDVGQSLTVTVTATNSAGSASATSAAVTPSSAVVASTILLRVGTTWVEKSVKMRVGGAWFG